MVLLSWRRLGTAVLLMLGTSTSIARAGVVHDAALGLAYAGFDFEGSRNPLSGGVDFLVNRNFPGNPLDFGVWDLTFQGPVSLGLSTGHRATSGGFQLDFALTTAPNGDAAARRLNYTLSGPSSLSGLLAASGDGARERLAAGGDPAEENRSRLLAAAPAYERPSAHVPSGLSLELKRRSVPVNAGVVAPEPTVLLLMLLGIPLVAARPLRRRRDTR